MISIRRALPQDHPKLLRINNQAVPAVNAHDQQSLLELLETADATWVATDAKDEIAGLLVTFAPGADYDSRNYAWLNERLDNFGYVDRIVVAPTHRRLGVGAMLYDEFTNHARMHRRDRLACEVNTEPPNPQSIAFHTADGWNPIGDLEHEPGYSVRFFEKPIEA